MFIGGAVFICKYDTYKEKQFLKNGKSLTACNFAAPQGTWTSSTFLEASILKCLEPGDHVGGRTFRAQKP